MLKKITQILTLIIAGILIPHIGLSQLGLKAEAFVTGSTPSPITDRRFAEGNGYDVSHERFPIYPGAGFILRKDLFGLSGAFLYNPVTFTANYPATTDSSLHNTVLNASAKGEYLQFQAILFLRFQPKNTWCFSAGIGPNIHFLLGSTSYYEVQSHEFLTEDVFRLLQHPITQLCEQVSIKRYLKRRIFIAVNAQVMQSGNQSADVLNIFHLKKNQFAGSLSMGYLFTSQVKRESLLFRQGEFYGETAIPKVAGERGIGFLGVQKKELISAQIQRGGHGFNIHEP